MGAYVGVTSKKRAGDVSPNRGTGFTGHPLVTNRYPIPRGFQTVDLVVSPAKGRAKVYPCCSKVLIYVGRIHYYHGVLTITPCQGITAQQRAELVSAYKWLPRTHDMWKHVDDGGWVTHLSLPAPFRARHLSRSDPHRRAVRLLLCSGWHHLPVPDLLPPAPAQPHVTCAGGRTTLGGARRR